MVKSKADYADNYTKVHMKRETYAVAKAQAKAQNRTVANYIAHLVQQDVDGQNTKPATVTTSSGVEEKIK